MRNKIEGAVLAALGHHKPDYRSPKRLDEASRIITDFIVDGVLKPHLENHIRAVVRDELIKCKVLVDRSEDV